MNGEITSFDQVRALLKEAKKQPIRLYTVWYSDRWRLAKSQLNSSSTLEGNTLRKTPHDSSNDFPYPDTIHLDFEMAHKGRYFTNYWLAWAYYTRMTKAAA